MVYDFEWVRPGLTPAFEVRCFMEMKQPLIPAIIGTSGSFVEVAFLPFEVSDADIRPAWAERGKMRKAWDSLSKVERRVAFRMLGVKLPQKLVGRAVPATQAQVKKYRSSCLSKLGCESVAELRRVHREFALKLERRAWAQNSGHREWPPNS